MKPSNDIPDTKNAAAFNLVKDNLSEVIKKIYLVGITGAGGAGKTTFANNLVTYFGKENSITIDLDDYLISREERKLKNIVGYDLKANKLELARTHLSMLKDGQTIYKPRYNHSNGEILVDEIVKPKKLIVVEGVTTLYPQLKDLYDFTIFMDALEETQIKSRIKRDVKKRGYTKEEAMTLFEKMKPAYKNLIEPTKALADAVCVVDIDYIMHFK
ncbi:hypothetical protein K9L97_04635 [Candidatus Woesearchaeota archaeon]|nr:hypothetical protein [Candidatus Woesearchaeota archaeon]